MQNVREHYLTYSKIGVIGSTIFLPQTIPYGHNFAYKETLSLLSSVSSKTPNTSM